MNQKTLLIVMLAVTFVSTIGSAYADHAEVTVSVTSGSQSECEINPCYAPSEIALNVGDVVIWSNDGTVDTQVTGSISDPDGESVFDSGIIPVGSMYSFKFEEAGTYYFSSPSQSWMKGTIIVSESSGSDSHDDDDGHGHGESDAHDHSAIESEVPVSMSMDVDVEANGGVNVHIMTEGWKWAPENVNGEHIPGEGHAHVYVDGVKINRVYTSYYYIDDVEPGEHTLRVALNTNTHNEFTVDGVLVEAVQTITVEEDHTEHVDRTPVEASSSMAVEVIAHDDALGGYNLQVIPTDFVFAGGNVNGEHVSGEGYASVSIDGDYHTRMYGEWLKIPGLEAGMHTITVELNANDHSPYHYNGSPVSTSITIHADDAEKAMDHGSMEMKGMDHGSMEGHDAHDDDDGHGHGESDAHDHSAIESEVPVSMSMDVDVEANGGVNVHIMTEGWKWAPENVNGEHIPGEGHAHVYVDGVKINRVYTSYYYIDDVEPGEHTLRVALNTNTHNEFTVDGVLVEAVQTITVEEDHTEHVDRTPVEASSSMAVEVIAHDDALGGYNLQVIPTDFVFAGGNVNGEHVSGEGYASVSIDGDYHTRMYGEWLKIPGLEAGMHTITVELNANDHSPYHYNGSPVSTSITIHADDAEKAMDHGSMEMKDRDHDGMKMTMIDNPSATGMLSDGTMVMIKVDEVTTGQQSRIDVVFDDAEYVNYDLMVTQNEVSVLADENSHAMTGSGTHMTNTLESDEPLEITIVVQGYGMSEPYTGPIDEQVAFTNIVPEFGVIAIVMLGVAMTCAAVFGTRIAPALRT